MPAKSVNNIHDKFIKELLADKGVAIAFLEEFLPKEVLKFVKLETLTYENTSYLNQSLEDSFADLVWQVGTETEPLKLCLLLEHKSYKDSFVSFQMLEYLTMGYQTQLKNKQSPTLIIPILYYHGKSKWKVKSITDFFKEYPQDLRKFVPDYSFKFIDLQALNPKQVLQLQHGMLRSALLIQQNQYDFERIKGNFENIISSLEPYLQTNLSNSIFVYFFSLTEFNKADVEEKVKSLSTNLTNEVMTLYDQLINEGIERGFEQGIEKTNIKTILNSFDNSIPIETIRLITGETIEKIKSVLIENGRKV